MILRRDETLSGAKCVVLYPLLYEKFGDTLSAKDVAIYLGISYNTACRLIKSRVISGMRIGREWRVPRHKLVAYLESTR